ncbi:hypothetical protein KAW44_01840 [Candidatus Bipolaricaulota bacterium]|nr:hypothetical protein [Candidatus Bipolaricaulota bacterium]
MPAPREVSELVKRFERNRETYRSSEYNETQAHREFIDPLFKALGWDIDNEQGYAEAYKDVVHRQTAESSEEQSCDPSNEERRIVEEATRD